MNPISTPPPLNVESEISRLRLERSKFTRRAASARNTERGYAYDFAMFREWAAKMNLPSLPATPETVSLYLTYLLDAGKKITTTRRRSSAIAAIHRNHGIESPVVGEAAAVLRGARRNKPELARQMQPLSVVNLRAIAAELGKDGSPLAIRNRAILVTGFASALRRSSLTELLLSDVTFVPSGLILSIRREKQDQLGSGRMIGLPKGTRSPDTCPVHCLEAWLKWRGDAPGPLFTHVRGPAGRGLRPEAIERMMKRCVERIGLDPRNFAGHSLRAGFITEAGEAGIGELLIASQSGHRSMEVLRRYFRRSELFKANPCHQIGL